MHVFVHETLCQNARSDHSPELCRSQRCVDNHLDCCPFLCGVHFSGHHCALVVQAACAPQEGIHLSAEIIMAKFQVKKAQSGT